MYRATQDYTVYKLAEEMFTYEYFDMYALVIVRHVTVCYRVFIPTDKRCCTQSTVLRLCLRVVL